MEEVGTPREGAALVEVLQARLAEKENSLQILRSKTKAFVDNMRAEKQALEEEVERRGTEIAALREQVRTSYTVVMNPSI